jgi:hypothetical protein
VDLRRKGDHILFVMARLDPRFREDAKQPGVCVLIEFFV